MFNFKGILIGAGVGAAVSYVVKTDMTKGAIIGALVSVAGPLVEGLVNKAMYPAAVAPTVAPK